MATTKEKINKDGSVSYEIRVSMGRDVNNKQLFKYTTWKPAVTMTTRQIEKELERQKILFEEKCKQGKVLSTSTKFVDFAARWMESNEDIHSPAYRQRARILLSRMQV